jgi:hypothetical protein
VLNRLERILQRKQSVATRTEDVDGDIAADLLNDIDEVTRRLSDALEALDHLGGANRLPLNSTSSGSAGTQTPRSSSILTSSSDDGSKMSAASSSWSFGSRPPSLSQRQSVDNETISVYKSEEEKQVVASRAASGPHATFNSFRRKLPVIRTDHQAMQFAYLDPMSVDIDSASSMILGGQPSQHDGFSPILPLRSSARLAKPLIEKPTAPLIAAAKLGQNTVAQENGSSIGRSTSLRSATLPITQAGKTAALSSSSSLRFSQRSPSIRQNREATYHQRSSSAARINILAVVEDSDHEPAEAPMRHMTELPLNETRTIGPSHPALIRPPARIMTRSTPAVKSRYRVVNSEETTHGPGPFASPVAQSPLSSPISPRRAAIRWASEPKTRHVSELDVTRIQSNQEIIAESRLNDEFASAIISSWNAGLWDQAKHNVELQLSRVSEYKDDRLTRRLHHMLGAIASLKGEPEQALVHFTSVFSSPVEEASQLDPGHCAAAYWMGDVYALLNRRTEALLAYSIAARSPQLQDAKLLQMDQQVFAEKESCRGGETKTGVNIDWDDVQDDDKPNPADSILDPNILARDVARMMIQADTQPVSSTCKLDPNRSRAMAFHDLGLQSGSWQDKHALLLGAKALDVSGPWPFPFDPFFVLENVRLHRLSAPEIDLLQNGLSATKIPKKSRLSFNCPDLRWLILTLRKCLTRLEMAWSEVMVEQSPRFIVRYASLEAGVAKTHFFSVPIYRLSFRPGYGVDICSDGISSSRIKGVVPKAERGVHCDEVKRVKKMVREFLEAAAKRHEATESRTPASPAMRLMV